MSYDIGMEVDTGARYPSSVGEWYNYTYNVSPMLRLAFGSEKGIKLIAGMEGKLAAPLLAEAIGYFREHMDEMRSLNPNNGWGDADSALAFLENIRTQAERHPKAIVGVS